MSVENIKNKFKNGMVPDEVAFSELIELAGAKQDLSGYATKGELPVIPDVSQFVTLEDIPEVDLSGYAKVTDIPAEQDLSHLATKDEINGLGEVYVKKTDIADVVRQSELPNFGEFAKSTEVDSKISQIVIPETDLSGYATKAEIPDTSGFVTAEELPDISSLLTREEAHNVYLKNSGQANIVNVSSFVTEPLPSSTTPSGYSEGYTLFTLSSSSAEEKSYEEEVGIPLLGKRAVIHTEKNATSASQRIHIVSASSKIEKTFYRSSYDLLSWGEWEQKDGSFSIINPMSPNEPHTSYPEGASVFYETQDTTIGKEWANLTEKEIMGGYRIYVETLRVNLITEQKISIMQTRPLPANTIGEFKRMKFDSEHWTPVQSISGDISGIYALEEGTDLFKRENVDVGRYYDRSNGTIVRSQAVCSSGFIPVFPGGKYKKNVAGHVAYFSKDYKFIAGYNIQDTEAILTIPAGEIRFISFSFATNFLDDVSFIYVGGGYMDEQLIIDPNSLVVKNERSRMNRLPTSETFLRVPTAYNDNLEWEGSSNQATHPSIVQFDSEWNNYKFWMVYTPYPNSLLSTENPTVSASNDGIEWFSPAGAKSPLVLAPAGGYNSDAHILYNDETDELEIWYREVTSSSTRERLYRLRSSNGADWSSPELMTTNTKEESGNILQFISPSVIRENGKYYLWVMRDWFIVRLESEDGKIWENEKSVIDDSGIIHSWHPNIQKYKGVYYMLNCDKMTNQGDTGELFYYESLDGVKWSKKLLITSYTGNKWDLSGNGVYRASLLFTDLSVKVIYGMYVEALDSKIWTLGLLSGRNIYELEGLTDKKLNRWK